MNTQDIFVVNISDMHSGGTTALFPDHPMDFDFNGKFEVNHTPTQDQVQMYKHWIQSADTVKRMAKGKRMIVVHNGDALEGAHHGSVQSITQNPSHQSKIHIELFETFLKRSGHSKKNGDELHYTSGTESHTNWNEYGLAQHFSHLDPQFHDEMQIERNGRRLWWTHHGGGAGKGANEGNAYRNWLRDIYFDCLKSGVRAPDVIVTAHFHKCIYQPYSDSFRHTIHGMILPSWQMKTRYAYKVAPFQRNDIGLVVYEISKDGDIRIHPPMLMS